jgi:hypothetical protein
VKRVYRYDIPLVDQFSVQLPYGALVLSAGFHEGRRSIWALVDVNEIPRYDQYFRLCGTGHDITANVGRYISTWTEGPLVWHLFEIER